MSDAIKILGHHLKASEREAFTTLKSVTRPAELLSNYIGKEVEEKTSWLDKLYHALIDSHSIVDQNLINSRNQIIKEHLIASEAISTLDISEQEKEALQNDFDDLSLLRTEIRETTRKVNGVSAGTKLGAAMLIATSMIGVLAKTISDMPYCSTVTHSPALHAHYLSMCPNPLVNPWYFTSSVLGVVLPTLAVLKALALLDEAGFLKSYYSEPLHKCNQLSLEIIGKVSSIKDTLIKIYKSTSKESAPAA